MGEIKKNKIEKRRPTTVVTGAGGYQQKNCDHRSICRKSCFLFFLWEKKKETLGIRDQG